MNEVKCYYPDWEDGFIIKDHIIGKDGYCCICGFFVKRKIEKVVDKQIKLV